MEGVKAVAGPMAVSIRDCELFMKVVTSAKPWEHDSAVNRTIWQGLKIPSVESITVGLVEDYGYLTPHPPVRRALLESAKKLEQAGIKVVPVSIPDVAKSYSNLFSFFRAAGNGVSGCVSAPNRPALTPTIAHSRYA